MTINFAVTAQTLRRVYATEKPAGDSVGYLRVAFDFSPDWDGLVRTAIFTTPAGEAYAVLLDGDDACMVPQEAIKPPCVYISVRGDTAIDGVMGVPTMVHRLAIAQSGAVEDVPGEPTPDAYTQIIGLMQTQAIDAERAETAQEEAEQAERTAESHAEQTGEDRIATGEDRVATGADRSAVNTALLGFAETTLPAAIESVENKADAEITRVGQAGDAQVSAVETAGAEQTAAATAQADRAEREADDALDAKDAAETAQGKAEDAQGLAEGAKVDAITAQGLAEDAQGLAEGAAVLAESHSKGGTASREGEDTDNALYYKGLAESAKTAAETAQGKAEDAQEGAEAAAGTAATDTVEAASLLLSGYVTDAQTAKTAAETAQGTVESVVAEISGANATIYENTSGIKAIEETMINYNPTAETRLTQTTADRVISLPKNAGEGGLKSVINGMTLTNSITNGDFSDGTSGWLSLYSSNIVENKILKNTCDGTQPQPTVYRIVNQFNTGDKLYTRATVRVTNSECTHIYYEARNIDNSGMGSASAVLVPIIDTWYTKGLIINSTEIGNKISIRHVYSSNESANGKTMEIQNVITINLTAIFGAGNEPTVADMDKLTASYFEGIKSVTAPRVKSVGKNKLSIARELWENGTIKTTTGENSNVPLRLRTKRFFRIKPGTSHKLSISAGYSGIILYEYDINKNFIGATSITNYVSGSNAAFIRMVFQKGDGTGAITLDDLPLTNLQLEEGSVATPYEPYKESFLYPEPKLLQRLPNGVCDTIENGNYIQRVKEYTLQASDITSIITTGTNIDFVRIVKPLDYLSPTMPTSINGTFNIEGIQTGNFGTTGSTDSLANIEIASASANNTMFIYCFAKGKYADLASAQTALTGKKLWYQLADPITTENVTSGIPVSYPSGSIILEPALADAGVYTDKISILQTAFPISSLESIKKINAITGEETPLDVSTAVINADKLSFTHPSLALNDIVFFTYFYPEDGCYGSNTFSYFDSRYVKVDSVTGKYYKIDFSIADGVPAFNLVEVV